MILKQLLISLIVAGKIVSTVTTLKAAPLPQSTPDQSHSNDDVLEKHEYTRLLVPKLTADVPEIGRAAFKGDVQTLRRLISSGANVEESGMDKRTPLLLAAAVDQVDAIAVLLEAGANINTQDSMGDTALHFAARKSADKAFVLLMTHRPKVDVQNKNGETPLILAAAVGSKTIVKTLIDSRANRDLSDGDGRTARKWAEMNKHPDIVFLLDEGNQ